MRVEPLVSRQKYDAEVSVLERHSDTLRRWGCFVVRAEYPEIDVVMVPRRPFVLSLPARPEVALPSSMPATHVMVQLPMLSARAFGVRLGLDDYDLRPPSVTLRDPFTWEPLPYQLVPLATMRDASRGLMNVVLASHPRTGLPFLCVRGTREYHEHPQHSGDDWLLYRPEASVFGLVSHVWSTLVGSNRANLIVEPGGKLQVRWELTEA